ncbi:MAG: hypothetical protein V7724_01135 [Sediminicola sp.]
MNGSIRPVLTFYFFLSLLCANGQESIPFGKLTETEMQLLSYDRDSSAHAVVLYERGDNYFKVINRSIKLIKEYHVKIKVLNEKGFDQGNIELRLYHNKGSAEELTKIQAVTHNGANKFSVLASNIFTVDISENWTAKRFTFPQIQKGSILEYTYTMTSPYIYNFNGWDFQSDIPKIYSEFNATIPGNYRYNRSLIGSISLDINEADIKKECFHIEGYPKSADCEILKYAMKDIPAFKPEEEYMLAGSNYISRLDFELSEMTQLNGVIEKFTKSWKDVDREFRSDKDIGVQLNKSNFFEKNVPDSLFLAKDPLQRAKNIYAFVQHHYTWNGKYSIYKDVRVKEAFAEKKGNVGEINISLINLLNAADLNALPMVLSTRENGLPKKMHPVMSDFNYLIAKVEIEGITYLLDATEKSNPFGMLPFRCLNHYGRVMDYRNDSYWQDIVAEEKNQNTISCQLTFDTEHEKINGIVDMISTGYYAVQKRSKLADLPQTDYLEELKAGLGDDVGIDSYEILEKRSNEKVLVERFTFEREEDLSSGTIFLNPFLVKAFPKNPFLTETRHYPIDFGHKKNYTFRMILKCPEGYGITDLPQDANYMLPDNSGFLKFKCEMRGSDLQVFFNFDLTAASYPSTSYQSLRELFKYAMDIEKNTLFAMQRQ